jgi:hypothetical protein
MAKQPDLSDIKLAGGSRRARAAQPPKPVTVTQPSRAGTSPITVHFPTEVRDQLKILAIEQRRPMIRLIAEALNDLFAKYKKPEIAPTDGNDS